MHWCMRTWRCFSVLQLRYTLILRDLNPIFIACLFKGSQKQYFFLQTLLFTAFLVTVLKILTYALVSTWSSVSSGWEHVKRKMHPWPLWKWDEKKRCQNPLSTQVHLGGFRNFRFTGGCCRQGQCKWLENRDLGTGWEFGQYRFAIWSCSQNHRNPSIDCSYYGPKTKVKLRDSANFIL